MTLYQVHTIPSIPIIHVARTQGILLACPSLLHRNLKYEHAAFTRSVETFKTLIGDAASARYVET